MSVPYKVCACFDVETNNFPDRTASAICYQFSKLTDLNMPCAAIDNSNVRVNLDIFIDRDFRESFARFDSLISDGKAAEVIPVIMVHNLAFEMWVISSYVNAHDAEGCSKSTVKPLTIKILEGGEPVLVFWDTLSFWGKSLEVLGDECGYPKLSGSWDYSKQRDNLTPLTSEELAYAREDVVVPFAYLGYYLRMNPEIPEEKLANRILTKTSSVRFKSEKRCGNKRVRNMTLSRLWQITNKREVPKSDDELYVEHACTRGGFTYCAASHASVPFHAENGKRILKFDANSMHPFHALSHTVPRNYRKVDSRRASIAFEFASTLPLGRLLKRYENPFQGCKFYGAFKFTDVRLKKGSVFERDGISTFASSRFGKSVQEDERIIENNESGLAFDMGLKEKGYSDWASEDAVFAFGKFFGASECILYLNELSAWEFGQQFDYDSFEPCGNVYMTGQSDYATDKSVLSFNYFYKAKTEFKKLKGMYEHGVSFDGVEFPEFVPDYLETSMREHDETMKNDVSAFYLSLKAELNSLYGIEATNEAKQEVVLTKHGYELGEDLGIGNIPKRPKTWYQYGGHIVGWSRVHQICFMLLTADKVDAFICGDTDSHKVFTSASEQDIRDCLRPLEEACSRAMAFCTARARSLSEWYPMDGLGFYECEGEADAFCAAWNKCYASLEGGKVDITMAGVPCDHVGVEPDGSMLDRSYNRIANALLPELGFDGVCNRLIGYNVTITHNVTGLNSRSYPEWASFDPRTGQPMAIYLGEMLKTIGDTSKAENLGNMLIARKNNPSVNIEPLIVDWPGGSERPVLVSVL